MDNSQQHNIQKPDLHKSSPPLAASNPDSSLASGPSMYRKPSSQATAYQHVDTEDKDTHMHRESDDRKSGESDQSAGKHLFMKWWLEAVACLLVLGALVAIIATLYVYDGKPIPKIPNNIRINSVISIYTLIMRGAAGLALAEGLGQLKWRWFREPQKLEDLGIYDNATRGPFGSIKLLMASRRGQVVAFLGAFVTVTMLLVDPFTQQMIDPYSCYPSNLGYTGSLPRTSVYYGHGVHDSPDSQSIDPATLAVLQTGLYGQDAVQVTSNCPSGNCTFPQTFNTVGFCHTCTNVTSRVTVTQQLSSWNISIAGDSNFSTPVNTANLEDAYIPDKVMMIGLAGLFRNYFVVAPRTLKPSETDLSDDLYINEDAKAYLCSYTWCVKTIQANISLTQLTEEVVATYNTWGPFGFETQYSQSMLDMTCLDDAQRKVVSSAGYSFRPDDKFIPFNVSILANGSRISTPNMRAAEVTSAVPSKCIYTASEQAAQSVLTSITTLFNGSIYPRNGVYAYSPQGSSPLVYMYWNGTTLESIDATMSKVMTSMTNHARETEVQGYNLSTPALGNMLPTLTCVHVAWGWVAYATANTILLFAFFAAMLWQTEHGPARCRHDFKTSALALACTGIDRGARAEVESCVWAGKNAELEHASHEVSVKYDSVLGKFIKED